MSNLILKADQKVTLSVVFADAAGNPASVDGAPEWTTSAQELVALVVSEDGFSAVASAVGPVGAAQVSVRADADLGDGVREIVGTLAIEIISGEAVMVAISAASPEPK